MKRAYSFLLLLAIFMAGLVTTGAQTSQITVSGVLYKATGAVCANCSLTISKARNGTGTLGSASVSIPADGSGAISFTARQSSFATITGNFTRGKYNFTNGVEIFFPACNPVSPCSAEFDSLKSSEDSLLALVTTTGRAVTAKTANYSILAADSGTLFANTGATGTVTFTLPTAAAGLSFMFYTDAAQALTVTAGASTTIRSGASVTASAGNITNSTTGNFIRLTAISTTQWIAESVVGTWTFN